MIGRQTRKTKILADRQTEKQLDHGTGRQPGRQAGRQPGRHKHTHKPAVMGESQNEAAFLASRQSENEAVGNATQLTKESTPSGHGPSIQPVLLGVPVHAALQVCVRHGPFFLQVRKQT